MTLLRMPFFAATALACLFSLPSAHAQKMKTEIPPGILTPDSVETRIGTLKFSDGLPDGDTAQKVYDYLDFHRAVEVYLTTLPNVSLYAMREGLKSVGADNQTIPIWENGIDSKSLFLTTDPEGICVTAWLDLSHGPMVIEVPAGVRFFAYDAQLNDMCNPSRWGARKDLKSDGDGGKLLISGPDYKFKIPPGYTEYLDSQTYGVLWGFRVIPSKNEDRRRMVENIKKRLRVYSAVREVKHPPKLKFINASGLTFNTVHANDYRFYEDLYKLIHSEALNAWSPDMLAQLEGVGIDGQDAFEKTRPFPLDDRMQKILTEAAQVGNAIARTLAYRNRHPEVYQYPGKSWRNPDPHIFTEYNDELNERVGVHYMVTGETRDAFMRHTVPTDSQRIFTSFDADKNYFDGGKSYKLHLPPNIPAKASWSVVLYDTQTRSELQTDQQFPSTGSRNPALKANADGSYDLYFSPTAPTGMEGNWVQTLPGKSWFVILRVNDPLEPWYKKEWQPDDVVLIK